VATWYDRTSEAGTFQTGLPEQLKAMFSKPGVAAYLADGCGLNYCLSDECFESYLIREGFDGRSLPASSK
jgi:hypothetical protein